MVNRLSHSNCKRKITWAHVTWGTFLTSRELMWFYACSWDVKGYLPLNSMAQIHTSVTLVTSRDLTCQHAWHISVVAHISWDVTYVSSALQTLSVSFFAQKNILFMSAATQKPVRLEYYLHRLPGAKSSHEITWHDNMRMCRLTWREETVSSAWDTQFMNYIKSTCFGTAVPSSRKHHNLGT